jgi:hypothetical protein
VRTTTTASSSATPIFNADSGLSSDEMAREIHAWNSRRLSDLSVRQGGGSDSPEESGRFFEGDIVLSEDQAKELYDRAAGTRTRKKRKFIGSKVRRWDSKKPIYFSFDGSHTLREQRVIELALEHWHNSNYCQQKTI